MTRASEKFVASTGEAFEVWEAMGDSLLVFKPSSKSAASPALFRDYLAANLTQNGKPVDKDALLRFRTYDFIRALKRIRCLTYGDELTFEFECKGDKCGQKYSPQVDVANLVERPPIAAKATFKLSTGDECKLRFDSWGLQEAESETQVADPFLSRVESIGGEPFLGCGTLRSRDMVTIAENRDLLDGDPGIVISHACPKCGTMHRTHLLLHGGSMIAFFGLRALL